MRRIIKRLFVYFLTLSLVLPYFSIPTYANEVPDRAAMQMLEQEEKNNNKTNVLTVSGNGADELDKEINTNSYETNTNSATTSGQCGDNLTWTLVDGTLTISGTGDMWDFDYENDRYSPWYNYRNDINKLLICEGVTSIGDSAFYEHYDIAGDLILPESIKSIGNYSFYYCYRLTGDLNISKNVISI